MTSPMPSPSTHRPDGSDRSVLFLDVDGVLNCRATFMRPGEPVWRVDPEMVALLNEVVKRTGCRVVMSSSWRIGPYSGRDGCRAILRARGVKAPFAREWRTPGSRDGIRGGEIAEWLLRNGSPAYAIVDDDSDMLEHQRPRFVQTSFEHGLTRERADRLIALLSAPDLPLTDPRRDPDPVNGDPR